MRRWCFLTVFVLRRDDCSEAANKTIGQVFVLCSVIDASDLG